MKILILYASKAGATDKCAHMIYDAIKETDVDIVDLGKEKIKRKDLDQYDVFVIGTPIYMGRIQKSVRKFLVKQSDLLMSRKLHFFICGMALGEEGINLFKKQVANDLFTHAGQVCQLGNEVNPERLNPLFRGIIHKIVEQEKPVIGLLEDDIGAFAGNIVEAS